MINCFVEMVSCGVKRLALSPPLLPEDYELIASHSEEIVQGFGIKSYLEKSLLVTHLQTAEFTKGKWSILYYKSEDVIQEYFVLKEKYSRLEKEGKLESGLLQISKDFMKLLSYPVDVIKQKISGSGQDPYMLIDL